jgi:hypothetical protein
MPSPFCRSVSLLSKTLDVPSSLPPKRRAGATWVAGTRGPSSSKPLVSVPCISGNLPINTSYAGKHNHGMEMNWSVSVSCSEPPCTPILSDYCGTSRTYLPACSEPAPASSNKHSTRVHLLDCTDAARRLVNMGWLSNQTKPNQTGEDNHSGMAVNVTANQVDL